MFDKAIQKKGKSPNSRHKNQRLTHCYGQESHENTKLKATDDLVQACAAYLLKVLHGADLVGAEGGRECEYYEYTV